MKVIVTIQQVKLIKTDTFDNVKFYTIDKGYLSISLKNGSKYMYKISTVLEIQEEIK